MFVAKLAIWVVYFVNSNTAANMSGNVVGGHFSRIEQFPHSVFIHIKCTRSLGCGGSILNQAIVITAAHCLRDCSYKDDIVIYAGSEQKQKGSLRKSLRFILHEHYNDCEHINDIALVRLNKELKLGEKIGRVVLMPNPFQSYNEMGFVAGWGRISDDVNGASIYLKHISQKISRRDQCGQITVVYNTEMPVGTICGEQWRELGHPFRGDSGSALVVRYFIQVGIVSFGILDVRVTQVYSDTGFFYQWIKNNTKYLNCQE